jgi:hypothetical protein
MDALNKFKTTLIDRTNTSGCIPFHGPKPFPQKLGTLGKGGK